MCGCVGAHARCNLNGPRSREAVTFHKRRSKYCAGPLQVKIKKGRARPERGSNFASNGSSREAH